MIHNHHLWRPESPRPYRPSGRVITASRDLLDITKEILVSFGNFEAACLWLGRAETERGAAVESIVVPKQLNERQNYLVTEAAMQEVALLAKPNHWTLLASVHSHPGTFVEHSTYDDEMTPSRNALSLVFPNYGVTSGAWPNGIGVHEYIDDYWHLLPPTDAKNRVLFVDGMHIERHDLR